MVLELPDDIKYLVGSGNLIIELEIDTREEEGWTEQVNHKELKEGDPVSLFNYKVDLTRTSWIEAEAQCQREGGNLASATSDKVNEALKELADGKSVWLGGRKESGKWNWVDNSAWENKHKVGSWPTR